MGSYVLHWTDVSLMVSREKLVIACMLSRCFGELKSAHESHLLPIISRISASELARFERRERQETQTLSLICLDQFPLDTQTLELSVGLGQDQSFRHSYLQGAGEPWCRNTSIKSSKVNVMFHVYYYTYYKTAIPETLLF